MLEIFHYYGFGLLISSEIEFPELLPSESRDAEVSIFFGKVPAQISGISITSPNFSYTIGEEELLFTVTDIVRYHASNGNNIIVEVLSTTEEERTIRLYVLATVMAAILLQRQRLPLHASAIIKDGMLILLSGDSGAGKSTLLAELIKSGYQVFSDDIVVLKKDLLTGGILANASYPMIKLWNDSIEKLDHVYFSDKSFKVRHDLDKYGFFFHSIFRTGSFPVSKILLLKKGSQEGFLMKEQKHTEAFTAIFKQVYRPMLIQSNKHRLLCFTIISELAKSCTFMEITRPMECKPTELLAYVKDHFIEENIGG